jgi:hypothetical protein
MTPPINPHRTLVVKSVKRAEAVDVTLAMLDGTATVEAMAVAVLEAIVTVTLAVTRLAAVAEIISGVVATTTTYDSSNFSDSSMADDMSGDIPGDTNRLTSVTERAYRIRIS